MENEERISAMLDGELTDAELVQVLESLEAEDVAVWQSHCMVGDLIRSSDLSKFHDERLLKQIELALDQEPVVLAPQLKTSIERRWSRVLSSVVSMGRASVALASVCLVAVFVYRVVPPLGDHGLGVDRGEVVGAADLALWEEYLMAHQQHSVHGLIPSLSSMARTEPRNLAMLGHTDHGIQDDSSDWLNVWGDTPSQGLPKEMQLNYVSATD